MNVYITYDRYEHDEWFSVYHIETNKARAIKHCKEIDLPDFIGYGPDDCHSFQLQKVSMTKAEYERLCELVDSPYESCELDEIMKGIFEQCDWYGEGNCIISSDGCSDNVELIEYYCIKQGIEADDDDAIEAAQDELSTNEELYKAILREYIAATY